MPLASTFGDLLKSYRVRKGKVWTQKTTAEELGINLHEHISLRTYVGWENGEAVPSTRNLLNIVAVFKLDDTDADVLFRAVGQVAPELQNLPFFRNHFFTGRETHLELLDHHLKQSSVVTITQPISISGLGGIGKTQIALEYAHRNYPKVYRCVLWANAADKVTLEASYVSLAYLLMLPEKDTPQIDRIVQAVKTWLDGHTNWLLILDNADDIQLAYSFLPARPGGHILLTTRSQVVGESTIKMEIEPMELEEGELFLLRRSGVLKHTSELEVIDSDIRVTATHLVKLLGCLPLALDQAGAYINEANDRVTSPSFIEYMQIYQDKRRILLKRRGSLGQEHPEAVVVTFEVSLKKAHELFPSSTDVLSFCAFLHPDAIPEGLFGQENDLKLHAHMFNEAIIALRKYSLIKRDGEKRLLSVHRLVQAVLKDSLNDSEQEFWARRIVQVVGKTFPQIKINTWKQCDLWLPHALICMAYIDKYDIQTLEAAYLLNQTGNYLQKRGRYGEAEQPLRKALEIKESLLGSNDLEVANALHRLAELYRTMEKRKQAEPLFLRALDIRKQQLGEEHPHVATSLNDLALFYRSQGRFKDAEPLHIHALEIREKILGPDHLDVATTLNNLAGLYRTQGEYAQAEPLFLRALDIRKRQLGEEHLYVGQIQNNLAALYLNQKKYAETEVFCMQGMRIREQALGSEHPDVAQSLNVLGDLYRTQGRYEEAEKVLIRALRIREQYLGNGHFDTHQSLFSLAELRRAQGIDKEAKKLYKQVIQDGAAVVSVMYTALSLNGLAYIYEKQGEYMEAQQLLKDALNLVETQQLGPNARRITLLRDHYHSLLHPQGREEAK